MPIVNYIFILSPAAFWCFS